MAAENKLFISALATRSNSPSQQTPTKVEAAECICSRPLQDVLCRVCGHVFTARVRKLCPFHPRAIHLMDCQYCPKCKNTYLHEFRASTPQKNSQEIQEPKVQLANESPLPSTKDKKLNPFNILVGAANRRAQLEDLGLSEKR